MVSLTLYISIYLFIYINQLMCTVKEYLFDRGFPGKRRRRNQSRLPSAVAPLPGLIRNQSLHEILFPEVRPERLGEEEFGVRRLPEQEVADSEFAAGSDEEIGVRNRRAFRFQFLFDQAVVDVFHLDLVVLHLPGEASAGLNDVVSSAVTRRHDELEFGVGFRFFHRRVY